MVFLRRGTIAHAQTSMAKPGTASPDRNVGPGRNEFAAGTLPG
jgi:hypothetical protein